MNTNRFLLIISAVFCFSIQTVSAQWYVGGGLGYTTENTVSLLHFSPEAGYSFHPRWTVGISTSLINVSKDVTTAESQTERKSVSKRARNSIS